MASTPGRVSAKASVVVSGALMGASCVQSRALASRNALVRDPSVPLRHAWRMSAEAPARRVPGEHLLGRHRERDVLDRLLQAARNGSGGVLVLHGEPGVGKTALLEYAVETSREFRVARTVGVEGEME